MGVYVPSQQVTAPYLQDVSINELCEELSAQVKLYTVDFQNAKTVDNVRSQGPKDTNNQPRADFTLGASSNSLLMTGTTSVNSFRYVIIYGNNAQTNVSYPSGAGGILYKAGNSPTFNRDYITAAESASGYRLYCRGVNYNDYSYMSFTSSNISYGMSQQSWIWRTATGTLHTVTGSPTSSVTLYANSYTSNSHIMLENNAG